MSDSTKALSIGFSPCPNDTFIFHALVHGKINIDPLILAPPVLEDVETLNRWAQKGKLDISKVSFHALGHILQDYVLLNSGAALGRGCGPLLVAKQSYERQDLKNLRIAIPGELTTAALLLQIFAPDIEHLVPMVFSQIMDSIDNGEIDAGVIIHESRFTYANLGLQKIVDLGAWWEEETGLPIPLGGIVAKRSLGKDTLETISNAIQGSVQAALDIPHASLSYMKGNAQELAEEVLTEHVNLYVNNFSVDLGNEGIKAVEEFLKRGAEAGLFDQPRPDFYL